MINKLPKILIVLLIILVTKSGAGQEVGFNLTMEEDSLKELFVSMNAAKTDDEKLKYNGMILEFMEDILFDYSSFDHPFNTIRNLGKIKSEDDKVRIYNWNIMFADNSFKYYGFVQYHLESKDEYLVYRLEDISDVIEHPERQTLKEDSWYGALYYEIVEVKDKQHVYYTLLGWDGNSDLTSRKVVDVLYFTSSGKPRFGASIFSMVYERRPGVKRTKRQKRLLFEYSSKVRMSLKYDHDLKMIVFDHLLPTETYLTGNYQFYGPDLSHDGLKFKKGLWHHKEDILVQDKTKKGNKTWEYKADESFFKK